MTTEEARNQIAAAKTSLAHAQEDIKALDEQLANGQLNEIVLDAAILYLDTTSDQLKEISDTRKTLKS